MTPFFSLSPDIDALKSSLTALGADHVLTYDEFLSRETNARKQIKEWVGKDGEIKLALNCVGGKETAEMCKTLAVDGKLGAFPFSPFRSESRQLTTECTVTYGGMAKTGLTLPPSLFIFKKLTSCVSPSTSSRFDFLLRSLYPSFLVSIITDLSSSLSTGFWLSNWVQTHPEERISMMQTLATLTSQGKLKEPETEVVKLGGTDEEVGAQLKEVMTRIEEGRGKKVLLHWSEERVE